MLQCLHWSTISLAMYPVFSINYVLRNQSGSAPFAVNYAWSFLYHTSRKCWRRLFGNVSYTQFLFGLSQSQFQVQNCLHNCFSFFFCLKISMELQITTRILKFPWKKCYICLICDWFTLHLLVSPSYLQSRPRDSWWISFWERWMAGQASLLYTRVPKCN